MKAAVGAAGTTPNLYRGAAGEAPPVDAEAFEGDAPEKDGDEADRRPRPRREEENGRRRPPPPAAEEEDEPDGPAAKFKALFGNVGAALGGTEDADDWGGDVE